MKDPRITALVNKFEAELKTLNTTWAQLQKANCYVSLEQHGTSTYNAPKSFEITEITQSIKYKYKEKTK